MFPTDVNAKILEKLHDLPVDHVPTVSDRRRHSDTPRTAGVAIGGINISKINPQPDNQVSGETVTV